MNDLKGCLVGCGFFGRIQLDAWQRVAGATIEAVCDSDRLRAEGCAADFGARAYTDARTMLERERPDFLDIVTRAEMHLPMVELAAEHRIPALCQKPMANTWAEALEIAAIANRAGIRLMMNENWRWQPWYRHIHDLHCQGAIGRPVFYRSHMRRRDGLGEAPYEGQTYMKDLLRLVLLNVMVHFVDTARFLFGETEEIYCQTQRINPVIAGEDLAVMVVRHRSGLRGAIDGHRCSVSFCGGEPPGAGRRTMGLK